MTAQGVVARRAAPGRQQRCREGLDDQEAVKKRMNDGVARAVPSWSWRAEMAETTGSVEGLEAQRTRLDDLGRFL
jgi:hypothetical protein